MYIVFYSTSKVFMAEEKLKDASVSCQVVPTPVQDKAYCGVCIMTQERKALELLKGIEFKVIEEA